MKNERSTTPKKYVKLFNSGAFVGVVELMDSEGGSVDVRTMHGELLTVGLSDIAELSREEEAEFLRTIQKDSTHAGPASQAM